MTQDEVVKFILFQFPIAAALAIAIYKGWIEFGPSVKAKLAEKDKQIAFHDQLRQEAIADKKVVEERASKQHDAIGELTNVVREALEFNAEVTERRDIRDTARDVADGKRRRSVARANPRTSKNS